ncbi:hypothetical protein EYC80_009884 [Monilinia laxa]|uniref:Uncharacterized protein n=1 Tax=Monilinia laxa TaxID=61186 RepID=A0A5N6JQZ2_MONLA|nr:hypothetical protein EYC80_009884 [Monilinia laxa]
MYTAVTNGLGGGVSEGPFHPTTINPQALNQGSLNPSPRIPPNESPRGIKRSRSPDTYSEIPQVGNLADDGMLSIIIRDSKPRKRGRPMKAKVSVNTSENSQQHQTQTPNSTSIQGDQPQTPQSQHTVLPLNRTPVMHATQTATPKPTPKQGMKALPTVRDHTTDQLSTEGDEYIPREYDDQGEKKVTANGHLNDGREYRCRTFYVPNRGDKLFMLATECARVLGYRDSYLLFNKNRSLYKIIATQAEKEDLIHQEILPFSYRSRQIAIVTAKSMFRQFGSRVIVNGRRVRDDYWETKARKQGFTEDDLAGEKRPGAAKARDAAAAAAEASAALAVTPHHPDLYSNGPGHYAYPQHTVSSGMMGIPGSTNPLPMITTLAPEQTDMRLRDYSNIQRPRQELTGTAYQDRTQPSSGTDLSNHVNQAAEYSKQINQQRSRSHDYLERRWRQPHEVVGGNMVQPVVTHDGIPSTQALRSPQASQSIAQQPILAHQGPQHIAYSQPSHQPGVVSQPPIRSISSRQDQIPGRSPNISIASTSNMNQGTNPYQFTSQNHMWPSSQPQQSPQQHAFNPSYPPHPSQQSPHIQQSPHQPPPPQIRQSGSNPQIQPSLQYPSMQGMGQNYPAPRNVYQSDSSNQQFMQPATSGPQPGAQGWAPQQPAATSASWGWTGQSQ